MRCSNRPGRVSSLRRALLGLAAALAVAVIAAPGPAARAAATGVDDEFSLWIELEPISVPIVRRSKIVGQALVAVTLSLETLEDRRRVITQVTRIQDALLRDFSRYSELGHLSGETIDLASIKKRFQRVVDRQLGTQMVLILIRQAQLSRSRR